MTSINEHPFFAALRICIFPSGLYIVLLLRQLHYVWICLFLELEFEAFNWWRVEKSHSSHHAPRSNNYEFFWDDMFNKSITHKKIKSLNWCDLWSVPTYEIKSYWWIKLKFCLNMQFGPKTRLTIPTLTMTRLWPRTLNPDLT